jgi:tetratricopeptide (TPR) repeat protein
VSPSRRLRALLAHALAVALALALPGAAFAEETPGAPEVGTADDAGKPSGEPSAEKSEKQRKKAKKKKSRKEERAERKYQIGPDTAKVFEKVREHMEAERYAEAEVALAKLRLNALSPYERAQAHRHRGYVLYGKGENEAAIEHMQKALAEEDGLSPRERAETLFQIASLQAGLDRWKEVVATLEAWLQTVERPNSLGYYLMALSQFQLGDLDAALPPAQKAVEIAKVPQQAWLQLLLAILLTKQEYAAAKPVLDQMIALYPNSGKEYWLQLSSLHGVTGDEARALGVLELAYRRGLLSEDRDLLRLLQFTAARGMPYRAARIFETEMAQKKRFQDDAEALQLLSYSWILAREPAKALEPLSRAAELSKTGDLYVHLAGIHLLEERWADAVAVLRKALAKGGLSDPGAVQLMLGIAYYNEHQLQEARGWFAQAQRSQAMREQAETWLQHVDREIAAQRPPVGTGG